MKFTLSVLGLVASANAWTMQFDCPRGSGFGGSYSGSKNKGCTSIPTCTKGDHVRHTSYWACQVSVGWLPLGRWFGVTPRSPTVFWGCTPLRHVRLNRRLDTPRRIGITSLVNLFLPGESRTV